MAVSDTSVSVAPEVLQFLSQPRPMLINEQWVQAASGKHFPVYNPATGEVMAQVAEGDKEDINRAVQAARAAFDHGPWHTTMTPSIRGRLMNKLADLIVEAGFPEGVINIVPGYGETAGPALAYFRELLAIRSCQP